MIYHQTGNRSIPTTLLFFYRVKTQFNKYISIQLWLTTFNALINFILHTKQWIA